MANSARLLLVLAYRAICSKRQSLAMTASNYEIDTKDSLPPRGRLAARLERALCTGRWSFYVAAIIVAAIAIAPGASFYRFLHERIAYQETRNHYLKSEVAKLDKQISAVRRLRRETRVLIDLTRHAEAVQDARAVAAGLFNFLARDVPAGIQLVHVQLDNGTLELQGRSHSEQGAAALQKSIDRSLYLDDAELVSSPSMVGGGQEFTIRAKVRTTPRPSPAGMASGEPEPEAEHGFAADQRPKTTASKDGIPLQTAPSEWVPPLALGIILGVSALGYLIRRWWRKRATQGPPRLPVFGRAKAEFMALNPWRLPTWGLAPRLGVLFTVFAATIFACTIEIGEALDTYGARAEEESRLKDTFLAKKRVAVNLDLYQKQLLEVQREAVALLKTLPSSLDREALAASLRGIAGKQGLSISELATDGSEIPRRYNFSMLPVSLKAEGGFNSIGTFVSRTASLATPLVLAKFELAPREFSGSKGKDMRLSFVAEFTAWRYADADAAAHTVKPERKTP